MPRKHTIPELNDPEWLRTQYATKSPAQIAREIGVCTATVYKYVVNAGIPTRPYGPPPRPPEERDGMIPKTCQQCGESFFARRNAVANGRGFFCSRRCRDASNGTDEQRFNRNVAKRSDGCWEWTGGVNHAGYGLIRYESRSFLAHRLSWILHNGPIPDGVRVLHQCDNPPCVNPAHLFLGDDATNVADKVAKDRQNKGVRVPSAKLTDDDVRTIRALHAQGTMSNRAIARQLGIGREAVNRIVRGVAWKHVT